MITHEEVMPLLLEACPSFREHWETDAKEWGRDEERGRLYYIDAGEFAAHIVSLVKADTTDELPAIFEVIARLHIDGDEYVKELATIGYLEALQNVGGNRGLDPSIFEPYLGPESKKWWRGLNAFWEGRLPRVQAIDD